MFSNKLREYFRKCKWITPTLDFHRNFIKPEKPGGYVYLPKSESVRKTAYNFLDDILTRNVVVDISAPEQVLLLLTFGK